MTALLRYAIILFLSLPVCLYSCKKEQTGISGADIMQLPKGFPAMPEPENNRFSLQRWALGKQLFYDKRLSRNNTISCGSCHHAALAFSDSLAFSPGDGNAPGTSNAPSLANIGYHPYFTRAGGVPTLEMQVLVPVQEHNEFNTNLVDVVNKLNADAAYARQAQEAYNRPLDAFVITRALAQFERSFISGNSAFDDYFHKGKQAALNESEQRGYALFMSTRTNCSGCHSGFNLTNYAFENNGLYLSYSDSGRMRFTQLPEDRAKFKVPSLRNVALTAPYMHDGSINSLEAVIEHYNSGGQAHPSKSNLVQPLHLTSGEKKDIVNFLKSLSDYSFTRDKKFKL
ncbi:MAG: c-type cytochrome [Sphingobacteriales bacterium]|nr:MAG: c-type cytochrome [Sphingobacteriales bacterium]